MAHAIPSYASLKPCCFIHMQATVFDEQSFTFNVALRSDTVSYDLPKAESETTLHMDLSCSECGSHYYIENVYADGVPEWVLDLFNRIDTLRTDEGIG